MAIELLGFPTTLGLPRTARQHAPAALRTAGLVDILGSLGQPIQDLGDLPLPASREADDTEERVRKVVDAAERQARFWQERHRPENLMLTIGGDHSTSLGTILALSRMGHSFDVVWIDAHGDFNIIATSPTGNPHGMVLSLACGMMPSFLTKAIDPSTLKLWGIRDLDPGERLLLQQERVEVLSPDQVRQQWQVAISRLKPNVLLSFDIDSVEPEEAPGTMTPVPGGFHREEALELVAQIARQRRLLAIDIVEFHPDQDQHDLTTQLALDVAKIAISTQAERWGVSLATRN